MRFTGKLGGHARFGLSLKHYTACMASAALFCPLPASPYTRHTCSASLCPHTLQMAGEVGLSGGGGTGPGLKKSTSEAAMAAAHRRSQSSGSTVAQRLAAQQQKLVAGLERFQAQQQQLQQQRRLSGGQIPSDLE